MNRSFTKGEIKDIYFRYSKSQMPKAYIKALERDISYWRSKYPNMTYIWQITVNKIKSYLTK